MDRFESDSEDVKSIAYSEDEENMEFDWDADEEKMKHEKERGEVEVEDEDEKMYDEGEDFKAERNAFERVGFGDDLIGIFSDDPTRTRDPLVLFRLQVRAISLSIMDHQSDALSQKDMNTMILKAEKIPHIYFKNATAYVLGYIASQGGEKITEKKVAYVFKNILPLFDIKKPDVIRYTRYWLSL